jgi:hypothetical protein
MTHKMRASIIVFNGAIARAKCTRCKEMVEVPLRLTGATASVSDFQHILYLDAEKLDRQISETKKETG